MKDKGTKRYELTNHLGNVLSVVSDELTPNGEAQILSAKDYYPFGMSMPSRTTEGGTYRYGFNGQEQEEEINLYSFDLRLYAENIGRWLTPDPKKEFHNPYLGIGNNPIARMDPDGGSTVGPGDPPTMSITFTRSTGITDENYSTYQDRFINNVNNVWGINDEVRNFLNDVSWSTGIDGQPVNLGNSNKEIRFIQGGDRSFVQDNTAFIREQDMGIGDNTPAHEFGHFRGVADRYFEVSYGSSSLSRVDESKQREVRPIPKPDVISQQCTHKHEKGDASMHSHRDFEYNSRDNLYSTMTATITTFQLEVFLGKRLPEPDYQQNRGVLIYNDIPVMYKVSGPPNNRVIKPLYPGRTGPFGSQGVSYDLFKIFIIQNNRF